MRKTENSDIIDPKTHNGEVADQAPTTILYTALALPDVPLQLPELPMGTSEGNPPQRVQEVQ